MGEVGEELLQQLESALRGYMMEIMDHLDNILEGDEELFTQELKNLYPNVLISLYKQVIKDHQISIEDILDNPVVGLKMVLWSGDGKSVAVRKKKCKHIQDLLIKIEKSEKTKEEKITPKIHTLFDSILEHVQTELGNAQSETQEGVKEVEKSNQENNTEEISNEEEQKVEDMLLGNSNTDQTDEKQ